MGIGQVYAPTRGSIPILNQNVNAPKLPQPFSLRGEHCTHLSEIQYFLHVVVEAAADASVNSLEQKSSF